MKTDIKTIAKFIAAAIWTDGVYDEMEKEILTEIAEAVKVDLNELTEQVELKIDTLKDASEDDINNMLEEAGKEVNPEDKAILFEIVLEVILVDGILSRDEVSNLMAIAEILGISEEEAILTVADMVKDFEDIKIEF